jgi:hypothetical protein
VTASRNGVTWDRGVAKALVGAWIIVIGAIALWSWAAPHSFIVPDREDQLQENSPLARERELLKLELRDWGSVIARRSYGQPIPIILTEHIRWYRVDEEGSVVPNPIAKDKRLRVERPGVSWLDIDEADPAAATLWRIDVVACALLALAAQIIAAGAVLLGGIVRALARHSSSRRRVVEHA